MGCYRFLQTRQVQRRLLNFREFRSRLRLPLIVVELADQGQFQLVPSEAELLLQLEGDVRIWQKERLVNLGIRALPREVEYVAWLDCDVIFLNSGWAAEAKRQLERGATVVQLFEQARHLAPGWEPGRSGGEALDRAETLFYEESFASALAGRVPSSELKDA